MFFESSGGRANILVDHPQPFDCSAARGHFALPARKCCSSILPDQPLKESPHCVQHASLSSRWLHYRCLTGYRSRRARRSNPRSRNRPRLRRTIGRATRVQRSRNLSMHRTRGSLRNRRHRSQPLTHSSRKRMLLLRSLRSASVTRRARVQQSICHRHRRLRRATARRALVVHHLLQAAMLKQHMLPSLQLVRRIAKLLRDSQHRSLRPTILHTRITVLRHP